MAFPVFLQEVQNGRLFRLLAKLGTINERPEWVRFWLLSCAVCSPLASPVCDLWPRLCDVPPGFRRIQRGRRRGTGTSWSFSEITCFTRWPRPGRLGSTSATSSPASTRSVSSLAFYLGSEKWEVFTTSFHSRALTSWEKIGACACYLIAEVRWKSGLRLYLLT